MQESQLTYTIPDCDEPLRAPSLPGLQALRALDFWRWVASDVCEDSTKGYFAEWLVAALVGRQVQNERRISYATCDVVAPHGTAIEVKATSYWQSWRVFDERGCLRENPTPCKNLAFRIAPTRNTNTETTASTPAYVADVYVFCFEHEESLVRWNPFELGQWEFYYLSRDEVQQLGLVTLSLKRLRRIFIDKHNAPQGLSAAELQTHLRSIDERRSVEGQPPLAADGGRHDDVPPRLKRCR